MLFTLLFGPRDGCDHNAEHLFVGAELPRHGGGQNLIEDTFDPPDPSDADDLPG